MDAETWTTSRRVDAIERELRDKDRRLSTSERRLSELERTNRRSETRIERLESEVKLLKLQRRLARETIEFTLWAVLLASSCFFLIAQLAR